MTRIACIDIGTVTVRLAVADVEDSRVERMIKQSTICNLGEGLARTGAIGEEAAGRVLGCVDGYLDAARRAGSPWICCTLTAAARDASNAGTLTAALAERGLHPEVIPGEVEGSLTFLGVSQDFDGHRILVADNGGGSTEVVVGRKDGTGLSIDGVRSVGVGCRRMTERFLSAADPPAAEDVARARAWAESTFAETVAAEGVAALAPERLVVTGGTVTSLAAMDQRLVPYDPRRVHLHELTRDRVEALLSRLATITVGERAKLPGLQPKRANVILGGAVAIAALMEATGFDRLTASESDLLFGLAICAAAAAEGQAGPLGWTPDLATLR